MNTFEKVWTPSEIITAMKAVNKKIIEESNIDENLFFEEVIVGKWSIAENIGHLIISNKGVVKALGAPKEFLKTFGKPNGPSRTIIELLKTYKIELAKGIKAGPAFTYQLNEKEDANTMLTNFESINNRFCERIENWSEEDLENYCIPHPRLGKFTVREMAFFTVFHSNHHLKAIQKLKVVAKKFI